MLSAVAAMLSSGTCADCSGLALRLRLSFMACFLCALIYCALPRPCLRRSRSKPGGVCFRLNPVAPNVFHDRTDGGARRARYCTTHYESMLENSTCAGHTMADLCAPAEPALEKNR